MGITEEDEEEDIEEVDDFSPVLESNMEVVEETTAGAQTPTRSKPGEEVGVGEKKPTLGPAFGDRLSVPREAFEEEDEDEDDTIKKGGKS